MAKQLKVRTWTNVQPDGIGETSVKVKLSETRSITKSFLAPSTASAFQKMVASAKDVVLASLYGAVLRGIESSVRVSVKNSYDTTVSMGGGKKVDLLSMPIPRVCAAINAHMTSNEIMTAELSTDEKEKFLKKDKNWYNARQILLDGGKVSEKDGVLSVVAAATVVGKK